MKNRLSHLFLAHRPEKLRKILASHFEKQVTLETLKGNGACSTFRVDDAGKQPIAVVKVINWQRERSSARVNGNSPYFHFFPGPERLKREFEILKKLSPHGLTPSPILLDGKYAVHEFCKGPLLSESISLKPKEAFEKGWNALRKLHALGEVHGDPDPDNIIETVDGLKFIDFEHSLNLQRYDFCYMRAFDCLDYCTHSWELLKKSTKISFQQYLFEGKGRLTKLEMEAVIRLIEEIPCELSFKALLKIPALAR